MLDYQKSLNKVAVLSTCELPDEDREHVLTVIDALKKRIPKHVFSDKRGVKCCPTCGVIFLRCGFKHCTDCGQALEW